MSYFKDAHPVTTEHAFFDKFYQDSTIHDVQRRAVTSSLGCDDYGDKGWAFVMEVIHTDATGTMCCDEWYQEGWYDEKPTHYYEGATRHTFQEGTTLEQLQKTLEGGIYCKFSPIEGKVSSVSIRDPYGYDFYM